MPELLSIHGRCPRCSQVLTVPAGQLQSVFRCARCQYRVLGATLLEEARTSPPRLAASSGVRPFEEASDDQHTRLHLPAMGDEEAETALPAQLVSDTPSIAPPRPLAAPLQRFNAGAEPDDQHTRLHLAGSFDTPAAARRAPPKHATLLGVPVPPRLSRFGDEPEDADDQATRLHVPQALDTASGALAVEAPSGGHTTRGMPAAPGLVPDLTDLGRFDASVEDPDDQHTRLQVPIAYEEDAPAAAAALRSPVAPRISIPEPEPDLQPGGSFGRATLQFSRWIDDWMRERYAVLLVTLAALSAIIAPVFDVLLGNPRQGATVIAANLALFFLWALGFAWLGRLRNDAGVWDYRVALTRLSTGARLAVADLKGFGAAPLPLRWRVVSEVSGAIGITGLALASALTLTHLVWAWPAGTGLLFLWRLFSGSCVVLSVIASREAWNVPVGLSPAPDVTAPVVAHFPAVIDLSLPLSVPQAGTATPLHQVLEVLSQWEPREWPNRDSYLVVLERHLMRHMGWAKVERERPIGTTRAEEIAQLLVDESLLIEVVRGFDADIAHSLAAKMRRHAKVWRGKPALIVVFDASRAELMDGKGSPLIEALHQSYPMLTVRMPSARPSVA